MGLARQGRRLEDSKLEHSSVDPLRSGDEDHAEEHREKAEAAESDLSGVVVVPLRNAVGAETSDQGDDSADDDENSTSGETPVEPVIDQAIVVNGTLVHGTVVYGALRSIGPVEG